MTLTEILAQIGHTLGWTHTYRDEISDRVTVEGEVIAKGVPAASAEEFVPYGDPAFDGFAADSGPEQVSIRVGEDEYSFSDPALVQSLHVGDKVDVVYATVTAIKTDYIPPDFSVKKEIELFRHEDQVVEVRKKELLN